MWRSRASMYLLFSTTHLYTSSPIILIPLIFETTWIIFTVNLSFKLLLSTSSVSNSSDHPMLLKPSQLLATLLVKHVLCSPYPLPNSTTTPTPSTICNSTIALCNPSTNLADFTVPPLNATRPNICQYVYPFDLTVLNSRYPDYNTSHLHRATQFFMLRRQLPDDGEIATRVLFNDLPSRASNLTCRLEFILPRPQLQRRSGRNPTFNVYQVEREASSVATWNTYEGNSVDDGPVLFGTVNGEDEALERTRRVGGVAAVNETMCNSTLSFQMGMKYNGKFLPNYWEFLNVGPPAWPVQGFRMVYGC